MADDSEVGRVSLGLELDNGDGKTVERQISNVGKRSGNAFAAAMRKSFQGIFSGFKAASGVPVKMDTGSAKAQIDSLSAVLDNTNAKIEIQRRKLADLKEQYGNTFNESRKNKLQEQIVNTEAALLRLTKQSDGAASKIWKLEESLNDANASVNRTQKPVVKLTGDLNKAAKAATRSDKSMRSAGFGARSFGDEVKYAIKNTLIYGSIFKALQALKSFGEFMNDSLKTNKQYAASLNAIKTNLLVAFQPIYEAALPAINALMSGLAKATAYAAAFTSALFGKTYKASYQAAKGMQTARKAMEDYGKAGKKAAGQLAAFDELNTLDTSKHTGGGDNDFVMAMPNMNTDGIQADADTAAGKVKTVFDAMFSSIKSGWDATTQTFGPSFSKAWDAVSPELSKWKSQFGVMFSDVLSLGVPLKNWFQTDLIPFWQSGVEQAGEIWSGLSESVRNVVGSLWGAVSPVLDKFVTDGLPRLTEFLSGAGSIFQSLFNLVKQIFDDIWQEAADPALQQLSKIVQDTLDILFGWWDNWGKGIVKDIGVALNGIKGLWTDLWESFLEPFVTHMLQILSRLWNDHLKDLVKQIADFIGKLVSAAVEINNKFILPVVGFLVKTFGPAFADVFNFIGDVIGEAIGAIADTLKGLIKALGGVIDFIAGVFTGDWKRAWNGLKTFCLGIGDAIAAAFKGAVNLIIDALNLLIRAANTIHFDIPDWVPGVGGKKFGINIPVIPKLAKGGLVSAPTLAMVGDNPGASTDPEVVTPLSKLQEMLAGSNAEVVAALMMIADILEKILAKGSGGSMPSETQIGRYLAQLIGKVERSNGGPLFNR